MKAIEVAFKRQTFSSLGAKGPIFTPNSELQPSCTPQNYQLGPKIGWLGGHLPLFGPHKISGFFCFFFCRADNSGMIAFLQEKGNLWKPFFMKYMKFGNSWGNMPFSMC